MIGTLKEDDFGRLALHGEPDPDQQQRQIEALSEHITQLKVQIEKLQAEISQLHGDNFRLRHRNSELEALVAKTRTTPVVCHRLIRHGLRGRRAYADHQANDPAGRLVIKARRCGYPHAPTASSSTDRASAGTVMPR